MIDASVASAAGGAGATFPRSKRCRDFLQAVLDVSYRALLTPTLEREWNEHQSGFARTWRRMMVSRRKMIVRDVPENAVLRRGIERVIVSETGRAAVRKDYHLIEAALVVDKVVASLDDTVRVLFGSAAVRIAELRRIIWLNPEIVEEACVAWLKQGARLERKRLLGFRARRS
ncbi:MAG TPA: hypothetical protein VF546_08915 [Pyrinomonadaceae bacterium]